MADDLDPFGRPKDDNPLASLGWTGDETASSVAPEPEPTQSAAREAPAQPADAVWPQPGPRPPGDERPSMSAGDAGPAASSHEAARLEAALRQLGRAQGLRAGRMVRILVIVVVVFAVLGGIISTLVDEGVDRADRFLRDLETPDVQAPAVPGADETPSGRRQPALTASGLSVNSLLRPAAFRRAMTRLRTGGYGRLTNLRVAPDRIDASMLTKDGRLRQVQIVPGGAARVLVTSPGGFAGARTMTMKGIDTSAPNRLTRSAAGRLKAPASRVDYLVLSEFAGSRVWNIYFEGGAIFSADSSGRITRRVS